MSSYNSFTSEITSETECPLAVVKIVFYPHIFSNLPKISFFKYISSGNASITISASLTSSRLSLN